MDWAEMFIPDRPLAETILRGTVIYICIFLMMRFVFQRHSGNVVISDILVLMLIADAVQNGMAGDYHSIPNGLALVATLMFWSYCVDWLGFSVPMLRNLVHPPPLPLIENGRLLKRNMRIELITMEELMSQLRENGAERVEDVKLAHMEGDGEVSVILKEDKK